MTAKENYLAALTFGQPAYVPRANEPIRCGIGFENVFRNESWTDSWGIQWVSEMEGAVPFPKGNPLADLDKLDKYPFPKARDLKVKEDAEAMIAQAKREDKLLIGGLTYLLFERVWALMGMENFFVALYEEPDAVHTLLHTIAEYAREAFDIYLALGVDGISFSEDLGSQKALMISPDQFRTFFLPEYRFIFENVIKAGKIIDFHSCGCIDAVAGDLAALGVTVLNPIQARANDLHKVKQDTYGKMALAGGVDTHLIMTGTPTQVYDETVRVLSILKPGGGYICGADQWLPNMPEANMNAIWQACIDHGRY